MSTEPDSRQPDGPPGWRSRAACRLTEPISMQATAARVAWHPMTELTLITNSRRRLIAYVRARDLDCAAREMETHLRVLDFMGRLARGPVDQPRPPGAAMTGT
jgi:hypothetical protein